MGGAGGGRQAPALSAASRAPGCRQDKEAWIKDKYVEKRFLRKPAPAPAREAPRRWRALKCPGHQSSPRAPTARRKARLEPVLPAVAALSSGGRASALLDGRGEEGGGGCSEIESRPRAGGRAQRDRLVPAQAPWSAGSAGTPSSAPTSWTPSSPTSMQGLPRLVPAVSAGSSRPTHPLRAPPILSRPRLPSPSRAIHPLPGPAHSLLGTPTLSGPHCPPSPGQAAGQRQTGPPRDGEPGGHLPGGCQEGQGSEVVSWKDGLEWRYRGQAGLRLG